MTSGCYCRLLLLSLFFFLNIQVSLQSVPYQGYVAITSKAYTNFRFPGWGDSAFGELTVRDVSNSTSHTGYMECLKWCVVTYGCHSFHVQPSQGRCFLVKLDRCEQPQAPLTEDIGFFSYDVRPDNEADLPATCFERCIDNPSRSSCDDCGRYNCWGDKCEICPVECWQLQNKTSVNTIKTLWPAMGGMMNFECEGDWQRIDDYWFLLYKQGELHLNDTLPYWMKIVVGYADGREFTSYFDSFAYTSSSAISVGNYIGGDAGNYWEAPFNDRELTANLSTNCLPFYYPDWDVPCKADGLVDPYPSQYALVQNNTLIERAFVWETCDFLLSAHTTAGSILPVNITKFGFYITNNMELLADLLAHKETLSNCYDPCNTKTPRTSCNDCGRINCWGVRCEICPAECWQLQNKTSGKTITTLWPTMSVMMEFECEGDWQRINENSYLIYKQDDLHLNDTLSYWLKIVVAYADGRNFTAYFDSFAYTSMRTISVGNYIGGDAGNYWAAPFSDRESSVNMSSNCVPFYYPPWNVSCKADGPVAPYEDQFALVLNDTLIERALVWETCDFLWDNNATNVSATPANIAKFDFYITNNQVLLADLLAQNETLVKC